MKFSPPLFFFSRMFTLQTLILRWRLKSMCERSSRMKTWALMIWKRKVTARLKNETDINQGSGLVKCYGLYYCFYSVWLAGVKYQIKCSQKEGNGQQVMLTFELMRKKSTHASFCCTDYFGCHVSVINLTQTTDLVLKWFMLSLKKKKHLIYECYIYCFFFF